MTSQQEHYTVKGSLFNDGGIWAVRGRVYDPETGTVRHRSKSTKLRVKDNTKRKAERMMVDILAQWEREANTQTYDNDPLFSEYVQHWIDRKADTLNPSTVLYYQSYADKHILPVLGNMRIRKMTLHDLQVFYAKVLKTHKPDSARKYHVVISGALLDAVRDGIIPVNFADYVEFPKSVKYEGKAYTPEQLADLLNAAREVGEPLYSAILFAACYGLRRSEILGLRWSDIDFDAGYLTITNTVTQHGDLRIEQERTKTAKSHRIIFLLDSTVPYLKELKSSQERAGHGNGKVCLHPDGRETRPDYLTYKTAAVMEQYALPHIRFHDLRHTAASMLSAKASPQQMRDFLGHEDISTTLNTYTHILDPERRKTSAIMDGILKESVFCTGICSGNAQQQAG